MCQIKIKSSRIIFLGELRLMSGFLQSITKRTYLHMATAAGSDRAPSPNWRFWLIMCVQTALVWPSQVEDGKAKKSRCYAYQRGALFLVLLLLVLVLCVFSLRYLWKPSLGKVSLNTGLPPSPVL